MRMIVSGGGTAGHINPAIAIAKHMNSKEECEILFVGTEKGLESKLVPMEGFDIEYIKVRGFKRSLSPKNLITLKELIASYIKVGKIIKRFKPDVVIGTGGYVSGPVVLKAARKKIPTLIEEQNAFPGITNKSLGKRVDAVALAFEDGRKYFDKAKRVECTGNPIKKEVLTANRAEARQKLGLKDNDKLLTVMGGSRGAERINEAVADMIKDHIDDMNFKIYFATGTVNYDSVKESLGELANRITLVDYIYNVNEIYAASDIIVCRAGAMTVSEIAALGKVAIFIPSPNVTANHQEYNARTIESKGGAKIILEKDLTSEKIYSTVNELLEDENTLEEMSKKAREVGILDSLEKIENMIRDITGISCEQ